LPTAPIIPLVVKTVADNTKIEWSDATWTDDRGRVHTYRRVDPRRPGQQLRRRMAQQGMAWCRRCQAWLPSGDVRQGACRPHLAEQYREAYAARPEAIRRRVHARRRKVKPLSMLGSEYLTEQFGGTCAYCPSIAETWDHIVPVARGGRTEPGNIAPVCPPCNSSKKDAEVFAWLARSGREPAHELFDVLALEAAA
jgi:5-methylcytosine-specific restriction endonuclease McrA